MRRGPTPTTTAATNATTCSPATSPPSRPNPAPTTAWWIAGNLSDPYTGQTIAFTKNHARAVQIDHVVALGEEWRSGASSWPPGKRTAMANDLTNLVAVDGSANEAKGDDGPAEWMPPAQAAHSGYGLITITVKAKYNLTITPPGQDRAHHSAGHLPSRNMKENPWRNE